MPVLDNHKHQGPVQPVLMPDHLRLRHGYVPERQESLEALTERHAREHGISPNEDFQQQTKTIRKWLNGGTVSMAHLAEELDKWAHWARAEL